MHVKVVEYTEDWVAQFQREMEKMWDLFGEELINIHHIGSTSVPGLKAKPIVDMMPVVKQIDRIDAYRPQMEMLGYECMGEFGIPGRRYFRKGGDNRTHQIHAFEQGDPNVLRHLAFRDYLRANREDAVRYGDLKAELARKFPYDIESYMDGKDALVKEIEKKALDWYSHL